PYDYPDIRVMNENHVDQALGNLISDSFIYSVKQAEGENYVPVDVALVPVGVVRSNFAKGPITISNAYEVLSLGIGPDGVPGYPLASIYLTGKELKTTAEVDASITSLMSAAQLYCSGLQYTFNPNRIILNRVTDVKLKTEKGELKQLEDDKLYRVVGDLYSAQMLGAVMEQSKGILSIIPKDAKGNPIKDFNKIVIYDQKGSEVKAWYAFASYLQSFDEVDGVPTIPAKYSKAENRKVVDDSKNIIKLVKNPNKIFFAVLAVVILFIAIVTVVVVFIVKKVKTKKKKND
ncbi:MAG: 5'-nucleotidase, partial [Acutalibacteraceae bacterium]